ncbi:MAG TPA: capsule assembly Wzi family protein [Gemmatimonadaceae bacterium]|nr:capsule assembly Wzi family protein [Gemmatimonadaceae bacterium]
MKRAVQAPTSAASAPRWRRLHVCIFAFALPLGAQAPGSPGSPWSPGSLAADRARLAEITGDTTLLRPAQDPRVATLFPWLPLAQRIDLAVVRPEVRVTWNSDLPYSLNDGAMWAGRGWNTSVSAGLSLRESYRGAQVDLRVAPALTYSENLPFQIIPYPNADYPNRDRSTYANPLHPPIASIDMPMRFGDAYLLRLDPGRTALTVRYRGASAGIATDNEWWGPGIRNALIMSNNAPGVPRMFIGTATPLHTRAGLVEARLLAGQLTQSRFFSEASTENRTLSALLATLRPAFDTNVTFGLARSVYTPIGQYNSEFTAMIAHAADAFWRWEQIAPPGAVDANGNPQQRSDQVASLFFRWVFPTAGFELYGEWARMDLPISAMEMLVSPTNSGGYTMGFQYARPRAHGSYLRLQGELTNLEQTLVFPNRPPPDFYTGRASPQGYTQRGQVIGAGIGPGASSQWVATDWLARRWQAGAFVGRIRWENDALYRQVAPTFFRHDVSILSGVRGGWRSAVSDFTAELTVARRLNYLFQNGFANPGGYRDVDVQNITLALVATPR